METLTGILVVAALLAVFFGINTLRAKTNSVITQAVFRGTHKEGQATVRGVSSFTAPVTPDRLKSLVRKKVNAYDSAPSIAPGLYLASETTDSLTYSFGSKLGTSFTAVAAFQPEKDGTCRGTVGVTSWTETSGLVAHPPEVRRVHHRVREAIREVGGNFRDGTTG